MSNSITSKARRIKRRRLANKQVYISAEEFGEEKARWKILVILIMVAIFVGVLT